MPSRSTLNFQLKGTNDERQLLQGIIDLLNSVPFGSSVVQGTHNSIQKAKQLYPDIVHPPVSLEFADLEETAGTTDIFCNRISINRIPEKERRSGTWQKRLINGILRAATLGHELRHVGTRYGYLPLLMNAQTQNEKVLAQILTEEDAWYVGNVIEASLFQEMGLPLPNFLKAWLEKYNRAAGREQHMRDALSKKHYWTKRILKECPEGIPYISLDKTKTQTYQALVALWLRKLRINVPPQEALSAQFVTESFDSFWKQFGKRWERLNDS